MYISIFQIQQITQLNEFLFLLSKTLKLTKMNNKLSATKTLFTIIPAFALIVALLVLSSSGGAGRKNASSETDTLKGLKDFYKDYFAIGVAVSPTSLLGAQGELIKKHFNSLTPENVMKPALIHPEENVYSWENPDKIVDFAEIHRAIE